MEKREKKTCHIHITHVPRTRALVVPCVFLVLIISFLFGWWAWSVLVSNSNSVVRCILVATTAKRRGTVFMWIHVFHLEEFTILLHMHMTLCNERENVMFFLKMHSRQQHNISISRCKNKKHCAVRVCDPAHCSRTSAIFAELGAKIFTRIPKKKRNEKMKWKSPK